MKTKIRSNINRFTTEVEFVALPVITNSLPSRSINKRLLNIPKQYPLADPEFNKPADIDALIGTTLYYKLLSEGRIHIENQPNMLLRKTLLGWIVVGEFESSQYHAAPKTCHLISLDLQLTILEN